LNPDPVSDEYDVFVTQLADPVIVEDKRNPGDDRCECSDFS